MTTVKNSSNEIFHSSMDQKPNLILTIQVQAKNLAERWKRSQTTKANTLNDVFIIFIIEIK